MNLDRVICSLTNEEKEVLSCFNDNKTIDFVELAKDQNETKVRRALLWLENKSLVESKKELNDVVLLDKNGLLYRKKGLPEFNFLRALKLGEKSKEDLLKLGLSNNEISVSIGNLRKKNLIEVSKKGDSLFFKITKEGSSVIKSKIPSEEFLKGVFPKNVSLLNDIEKQFVKDFLFRKDILKKDVLSKQIVTITKLGKDVLSSKLFNEELLGNLNKDMIVNKKWVDKKFRYYDLISNVPQISGGSLHPLVYVARKVKEIFLKMGFEEMKESPFVESSFWCMDSMWIPQDHPARDVQDTFYLPFETDLPKDKKFVDLIKQIHENGLDTGSDGYRYNWSEDIAKKALLRTHTTANTYRHFKNQNIKIPGKYFYLGRVFRNETISWKNLPEFHQVEGFIIADGLGVRDLMGAIKEFYSYMGIDKIKFKPTYNPYTEPSLEAFGYFEELGKWVELINSGVFRPESLRAYNIDVPVIAWGLGLERLAMMKFGVKDIRKLVGSQTDVEFLRNYKIEL